MTAAALAGCGDVSVVHLEAFWELGIELVAIADTEPEGRARAAALAPGVPVVEDHHQLLEQVRSDVVHVTTPHHQHAQVTSDVLAAGIHVVQEKPLANTLAADQQLVQAAQASTAKLGICFQNRYNLTAQALKQVLDDGDLGEVQGAYASVVWSRTPDYYQARPWCGRWSTAGGGLLINQAIHTLDLLQWLFGEPVEVRGQAASLRYGEVSEVEDVATAWFTHPGGITSTFVGSLTNAVHRNVELEVYGSKGVATVAGGLHVRLLDGSTRDVAERVVTTTGRSYWGLSHQAFIADFHSRLDDPEPFWIGPGEAMASLRMLKEVYRQSFDESVGHQ